MIKQALIILNNNDLMFLVYHRCYTQYSNIHLFISHIFAKWFILPYSWYVLLNARHCRGSCVLPQYLQVFSSLYVYFAYFFFLSLLYPSLFGFFLYINKLLLLLSLVSQIAHALSHYFWKILLHLLVLNSPCLIASVSNFQ